MSLRLNLTRRGIYNSVYVSLRQELNELGLPQPVVAHLARMVTDSVWEGLKATLTAHGDQVRKRLADADDTVRELLTEIEALTHEGDDPGVVLMIDDGRDVLPEGEIKCPNCERYNDRDDLAWHSDFEEWQCPGCEYADPYWNQ